MPKMITQIYIPQMNIIERNEKRQHFNNILNFKESVMSLLTVSAIPPNATAAIKLKNSCFALYYFNRRSVLSSSLRFHLFPNSFLSFKQFLENTVLFFVAA
ncbi:MAG: hypothetical protein LE169_03150 [Endomicrobium sp.]|nr:hypothetical protein [Endomicrobium sp.]